MKKALLVWLALFCELFCLDVAYLKSSVEMEQNIQQPSKNVSIMIERLQPTMNERQYVFSPLMNGVHWQLLKSEIVSWFLVHDENGLV